MDRPYWYPRGTLAAPFAPVVLDDAAVAFPTSVSSLMPPVEAIPEEFGRFPGTKWNRFVTDRFFSGIKSYSATPRDGIDPDTAWRHSHAVIGSWEPKHEYKEAAAAYLLSLWFVDIAWVKAAA